MARPTIPLRLTRAEITATLRAVDAVLHNARPMFTAAERLALKRAAQQFRSEAMFQADTKTTGGPTP